ncbi:MAG: AIR synthase-related protein, partial [Pseudomonadota bacterium]
RNGDFVRSAIRNNQVTSCHDLSDGGLAIALAEMSIASGKGVNVVLGEEQPMHALLFGEDQARYLITVPVDMAQFLQVNAADAGVPFNVLGSVDGDMLHIEGSSTANIAVSALKSAYEGWFPDYMDG